MVAEATKQMGVGIQYNMQLQGFSPSLGEALGIQPPGCSLALPPSWAPAFRRKNFTQQLFFSVKSARAGTGAKVLTQPTVQSTFILITSVLLLSCGHLRSSCRSFCSDLRVTTDGSPWVLQGFSRGDEKGAGLLDVCFSWL